MSDYTAVTIDYNTGTDSSPVWTGTTMAFGGTAGANEMRWQLTGGAGGVSTPSASWPYIVRPASVQAVQVCYVFTADTTGLLVGTYDGGRTNGKVFRFNFDNLGTPASAMQLTAYQDTVPTAPTPGTQTGGATDGRNIINGQATDTGSTSYLKGNAYGCGFPVAGAQETPTVATAGTTLTVTSGSAGSVSPAAASWLSTWQSLQGAVQYITATAIAKPTTAFWWYFTLALFTGPNMQTGTFVFVPAQLSYTYT